MAFKPWYEVEKQYQEQGMSDEEIAAKKADYWNAITEGYTGDLEELEKKRKEFLDPGMGVVGSFLKGATNIAAAPIEKWSKLPDLLGLPGRIVGDVVEKITDDPEAARQSELMMSANPLTWTSEIHKKLKTKDIGQEVGAKIRELEPEGKPSGFVEQLAYQPPHAAGEIVAMLPSMMATKGLDKLAVPAGMTLNRVLGAADKDYKELAAEAGTGFLEGLLFKGIHKGAAKVHEVNKPVGHLANVLGMGGIIGYGGTKLAGGSDEEALAAAATMAGLSITPGAYKRDWIENKLSPPEKSFLGMLKDPQLRAEQAARGEAPKVEVKDNVAMTKDLKEELIESHRQKIEPQSHEETRRQGLRWIEESGIERAEAGKLWEKLTKEYGVEEGAARAAASNELVVRFGKGVREIFAEQEAAREAGASPRELEQLELSKLPALSRVMEMGRASAELGGYGGRTLDAFKILPENAGLYERLLWRLGKEGRNSQKVMEALGNLDPNDTAGIHRFTKAIWKPGLMDYAHELWVSIGLLSGAGTGFVNLGSNALRQGLDLTTKLAQISGNYATRGKSEAAYRDLVADVKGLKHGIKPALKEFSKRFRDPNYNPNETTSQSDMPGMQAWGGKAGRVIRFPFDYLSATDLGFKHIARTRETYWLANRIAREKNIPLETVLKEVADGKHPKVLERAKEAAANQTFTEDYDINSVSGIAAHGINKARTLDNPLNLLKWIFPFEKTPFNLQKQAVQHSPLGIPRIIREVKAGRMDADQASFEAAKVAVGTTIMAAAYAYAIDSDEFVEGKHRENFIPGTNIPLGGMTGAGPADYGERSFLRGIDNWQPHNVVKPLGLPFDINLNRMDPVATIMGIAADLKTAKWGDDFSDKLSAGIRIAADNFLDKSFMTSFNSALDALSEPERKDKVKKLVANYARTTVPSFVRQTAPALDNSVRISPQGTNQPLGAIKGSIPILSRSLEAKHTTLGREVERSDIPGMRPWSPVRVSPEKEGEDIVEKEMFRLRDKRPSGSTSWFSMPQRKRRVKGKEEQVTLDREEYAIYHKHHQDAREKLLVLITSPSWEYVSSDEKKAEIISNIYDLYRDKATNEIKKTLKRKHR